MQRGKASATRSCWHYSPTPACAAPSCSRSTTTDIDLDRRLIRVRQANGGRQRMVPMHFTLEPLLMAYLKTRLPLVERALFVSVYGRRMSTNMPPALRRPLWGPLRVVCAGLDADVSAGALALQFLAGDRR